MKLRAVVWLLFGCYVLQLLTLTHLPVPPHVFEGVSDKKLHFFAFLMLGGLGYSAIVLSFPKQRGLTSICIFVGCVFAAVDESTQPLFNRFADIHDWGYDVLGLVTAIWSLSLIRMITRRAASVEKPREAAS